MSQSITIADFRNSSQWSIKKLVPHAILPAKAHPGDLGYDLFAAEEISIMPGATALISTGLAWKFPTGWGGLIRDRSSVATKRKLHVVAGVIDNGYTGEVKIALHFSMAMMQIETIRVGDKIAQLIPVPVVEFNNIQEVDELPITDRGENGFGSSGQ